MTRMKRGFDMTATPVEPGVPLYSTPKKNITPRNKCLARKIRLAFLVLVLTGVSFQNANCANQTSSEENIRKVMQDIELPAGGLIVHVGHLSPETAMEIAGTQNCLLEILCTGEELFSLKNSVMELLSGERKRIRYTHWISKRLPYVDNTVSILFVSKDGVVVQQEIERVLVPGGKAYILSGSSIDTVIKPVPDDIDEWTHYLHDSDNNAVARDKRVGPPVYAQWLTPPLFARNHDVLASVSSSVSAGGRIFSIIDEGLIASKFYPPHWYLVARDAYNGILLWKQPIESWEATLRRFRNGLHIRLEYSL